MVNNNTLEELKEFFKGYNKGKYTFGKYGTGEQIERAFMEGKIFVLKGAKSIFSLFIIIPIMYAVLMPLMQSLSGESYFRGVLGEYQYKSSKYSRAIDTYKKLLKLQSEFGCLETIAEVLYELACAYYKLNRTTEALNKYSETLKIREVLKDSLYTPWAHYYVASIHFAARDYKKALFHVEKSVLLLEKMFGKINDLGVEDSPVYRRAKRLLNSLEKNKLLWKNLLFR